MHKTRRKIFNMFIIFVLIICTYAFVGFLWYGHTVYPFHSIANSLGTMAAIFRSSGYFFDDLLIIDIHFTTFFILTFCWLMFVMVFGLLLAVITDAYHDVRSHKGYLDSLDGKDYEMIDFVLERLKIILKVKKLKPAFRRVKFQGLSTLSSTSSRTTASSVKTQSQTTSSLTSDPFDIDWDEVTKDDTNTVAEHVEQRWECLLDKLHQLEEYEQEEDHFYNRIMQMFGYDTNCPNQRFGTKGKMPVSGKVSAKGSSSNRGMKKKRTKTDAKLVAEKLQIEDLEVENPDPARLQRPIDSTELQSKPSGKPRQRNVFTRSQSTSVMTNKTQLECKPVRAISSASQMCPAATQPDRNRLAQSPIYEGIHKAWSE